MHRRHDAIPEGLQAAHEGAIDLDAVSSYPGSAVPDAQATWHQFCMNPQAGAMPAAKITEEAAP